MILDKPSREFFDSLGYYVYAYRKDHQWLYIGKGVGDRAYAHVKDKGYNWSDCRLLARNLERYHNGDMIAAEQTAFAIEAHLIKTKNPTDNKVSGRYNEVFEMSLFASLWTDTVESQRVAALEMAEVIAENELVKRNVGFTETRSNKWLIETGAREQVYFAILCDMKTDSYTIKVKSDAKAKQDALVAILENEGLQIDTSKGQGVTFFVEDLASAINYWNEFVS